MVAAKYVPIEKQSRKAHKQYYSSRSADWNGIVPVTGVIPDKRRQQDRGSRNNREEWNYDE